MDQNAGQSTITELRKAVHEYSMPQSAKELITQSHLLVICGVTAAGKNTVVSYLLSHGGYGYIVSHTTRAPRENHGVLEQTGNDYWFVSDEEMLQLVKKQVFVEVKAVHGDTFYGTSTMAIQKVTTENKQ